MALDALWKCVGYDQPEWTSMSPKLMDELVNYMCLLQLCRAELRLPFSSEVTVSDASLSGGAHS
eukprot:8352043-Karenia_brevis.AAC.1